MSELTNDLSSKLAAIMFNPAVQIQMRMRNMKHHDKGQPRLMKLLSETGELTTGAIAEILDVRPSSVTAILNRLEEKGLVERVKDENDARVTRVHLTEAGKNQHTERHEFVDDYSEDLFNGLTEDEQQQLNDLLSKFADSLADKDPREMMKKLREDHPEMGRPGFGGPHRFDENGPRGGHGHHGDHRGNFNGSPFMGFKF